MLMDSFRNRILGLVLTCLLLTIGSLVILTVHLTSQWMHQTTNSQSRNLLNSVVLIAKTAHQGLSEYRESAIRLKKEGLTHITAVLTKELSTLDNQVKSNALSLETAQRLAIETIRDFRYDAGNGYVWIHSTDRPVPRMLLHPTLPELNGQIMDDPIYDCMIDQPGNLFTAMTDLCRSDGEGFVWYKWPKPTPAGMIPDGAKVSHVRLFAPWQWIIGTGVYIDDIDAVIDRRFAGLIAELQDTIKNFRIHENGYLFIFDGNKNLVIHPSINPWTGVIIDKTSDQKTLNNIIEQYQSGSNWVDYHWPKPDAPLSSEAVTHYSKRVYIAYFQPFDWYICASVYRDEVNEPSRRIVLQTCVAGILILLLGVIFVIWFSKTLTAPLNRLSKAALIIRQKGVNAVSSIPISGPMETCALGHVLDDMIISIHKGVEEKERLLCQLQEGNEKLSTINSRLRQEITDRKAKEVELKSLREYLKTILDSIPVILVGLDADGVITQWNREATRWKEITDTDAIGRSFDDLLPEFATVLPSPGSVITKGKSDAVFRYRLDQGQNFVYWDAYMHPLDAPGIRGVVVRLENVTRRMQMEALLAQSEKMISIGGLAAGMAHEINNPLGGILMNIQVIRNRLTARRPKNLKAAQSAGVSMEQIEAYCRDRNIFDMMTSITDAGNRAADIIRSMLSFSRPGDTPIRSSNISELMDQAITLLTQQYDAASSYDFKKISIHRTYSQSLPRIDCHATGIQQVFFNILKNGAEAMWEAGTAEPTLAIDIHMENSSILISIRDNGPGMTQDSANRIFEPFFSTKPVDKGTGLGLSVCYYIITDTHNGTITVDSEIGSGTTFIITIPVSPPASDDQSGNATKG